MFVLKVEKPSKNGMRPPPEIRLAICTGYTLALKTLFSNLFLPKRAKFRRKKCPGPAFAGKMPFSDAPAALWTDHRFSVRRAGAKRVSRSAFNTTQRELHAIASAPSAGTSFQPSGENTPAASGMPTAL